MPSIYGCCDQQNNTKSLTISSVTLITEQFGLTDTAGLTPIDPAQQITTVLNDSNAFTVPTDGLAQFYSNNDANQQILHSMLITYTANGFDVNDMGRQAIYQYNFTNSPSNSQLLAWVTTADPSSAEGRTYPAGGGPGQVVTITTDPGRGSQSDYFPSAPPIGKPSQPLALAAFPDAFVVTGGKGVVVDTPRLDFCPFAAQNLGTQSSFALRLDVLLKDGTYATGGVTITIPAGAVKTNLVELETFTLDSITITPQKAIPPESPSPALALPSGFEIPVIANSGNSFTITGGVYSNDSRYEEPGLGEYRVAHSFEVTFDTSTLDPTNYPVAELECEIVIDFPGYNDAIFWLTDINNEVSTFPFTGIPSSSILTGGVVTPQIAYPLDTDLGFLIGQDIDGRSGTVKVRILNSFGIYIESNTVTLTFANGSIETI